MQETLRAKVARGVRWNILGQTLSQALQLTTMVVVARRLTPPDFAVGALSMSAAALVMVVFGAGFARSIIPKQLSGPEDLHGVFLLYVFFCVAAAVLLWFLAAPLGAFYQQPPLAGALRAMSFFALFSILSFLPQSLLEKNFQFKAINIVLLLSTVLSSLTAIALALRGLGYWALVWPNVVAAFTVAVGYFVLSGYRPAWRFRDLRLRRFLSFGFSATATDVMNTLVNKGEYLILGKGWGPGQLGLYFFAHDKSTKPFELVFSKFGSLLMPTLSALAKDPVRLKAAFLRITELGMIIIFPLMALLIGLADVFIPLLFGAQWSPAVVVFKVFVASWFLRAFGTGVSAVLYAMDKPQYGLINAGLRFVILLPMLLIFMKYQASPVAVAWGLLGAFHVYGLIYYFVGLNLVGVRFGELARIAARPLGVSILMLAAILLFKHAPLSHSLALPLQFAVPFAGALLLNIVLLARDYRGFYQFVLSRGAV